MKTVRRLVYGEILTAVAFVLLAFLALFSFFDLIDELSGLGRPSLLQPGERYTIADALLHVALLLPSRLYELMPIAVLIGTVYALARLAQGSEFTVLRTSGLGPGLALRLVALLGVLFALVTFAVGDYVAPWAERQAQLFKAQFRGGISIGQTGAWLRERAEGTHTSVNVRALAPNGELQGIRLFVFDDRGRVQQTVRAASGSIDAEAGVWRLRDVERQRFDDPQRTLRETLPMLDWPSTLSADMLTVALLKPERMRTLDLFQYVQHLQANEQTTQRYEIEFWRKLFYPLSCVVMVVLALPFAYLHFRDQGLSAYVFAGILIGISFFLVNSVFGHIGNLQGWQPWLAAAAPSALYSLLSLAAFAWLVLRR
ncbi:LPS export ABC transporter permease LptG [Tepidimonas sp.]|jgi:lipopolysaccharide export system permease protein|uniref:LPS export ABC transporter permease LptG n=1 Tax=Tepidimonas sp. TaxID=2002775 RepID=UPI0026083A34|nr:LPS export ABC transporter permease LptG [Tepidimonas sp.]MDT7929370.1 LPS export ABC transporter permease LptG [Tepidimonas sp.]